MRNWTTQNGQRIAQVLRGRCNCFLITSQNKHLLVDTGRKNQREKLIRELERRGVTNASLVAVILTHSHFDHAENAATIKERFKTAIIINQREADYLARGDNPVIRGSNMITRFVTDLLARKLVLRHFRYQPAVYDILVDERYDLNHLGFNGYLLHTPGHSPGSMCVIIDNEIALVGDAMFGVFKGSVFPPFAENPKLIVQSWKKLLDTGCSLFLPAHGWERSRAVLQQQYAKYPGER